MHAVATTPVGLPGFSRSGSPGSGGLPRYAIGSAPTLYFSRLAQRSLTLRPACVLSRLRDPLTSECCSAIRYLLSPLRLLPAGATSCRVGLSPTGDRRLCTAHRIGGMSWRFDIMQRFDPLFGRSDPLLKAVLSPIACWSSTVTPVGRRIGPAVAPKRQQADQVGAGLRQAVADRQGVLGRTCQARQRVDDQRCPAMARLVERRATAPGDSSRTCQTVPRRRAAPSARTHSQRTTR
jgi:hypothetical protein